MKYTIKWESNGKKTPIIWEKYKHQFPRFSPYDEFCCIFLYYEKLTGKPMHFPYDEVYHRMGIGWEKSTYTMGISFPDFSHTMSFVVFSRTVGNLWGILKYTIGWELDGKKAPILWKKYGYRSPRLSPYHGFCCIFSYCGKFMGKPMYFPYAEVYHKMGI